MEVSGTDLHLKDETFQVLGSAMEVLNALGHGLLEKPYERAIAVEFGLRGVPYVLQRPYQVIYKSVVVGDYIPDIIAYGKIVIEIKCIDKIGNTERGQVLNYLRITGLPVGFILNFRRAKLEWERVVL